MRRSIRFAASAALNGLLALALFAGPAEAQRGRGGDSTAGRGLPMTPTHALKFTTDEGTWLSLDLSPDGRTIVFELLGDLYTLPDRRAARRRASRAARRTTRCRTTRPTAKRSFSSATGRQSDNVWMANADGTSPRQVTRDNANTHFQSPTFTPDGKYIVVVAGNDLHMYFAHGGTGGFRLTGTRRRRPRRRAAGRRARRRGAERVPRPDGDEGRALHLHRDAQQHRRRLQPDVARLADRRGRSRDRPHLHEDERGRQRHAPRAEPRRPLARLRDAQRRRRVARAEGARHRRRAHSASEGSARRPGVARRTATSSDLLVHAGIRSRSSSDTTAISGAPTSRRARRR